MLFCLVCYTHKFEKMLLIFHKNSRLKYKNLKIDDKTTKDKKLEAQKGERQKNSRGKNKEQEVFFSEKETFSTMHEIFDILFFQPFVQNS